VIRAVFTEQKSSQYDAHTDSRNTDTNSHNTTAHKTRFWIPCLCAVMRDKRGRWRVQDGLDAKLFNGDTPAL